MIKIRVGGSLVKLTAGVCIPQMASEGEGEHKSEYSREVCQS